MVFVQGGERAGPCRWRSPGIPGLKRPVGEFVPIALERVAAFGRMDVEKALIISARDVICWIRRHVDHLAGRVTGRETEPLAACKLSHRRRPGEGVLALPYRKLSALICAAGTPSGSVNPRGAPS
jgi:hypothetical protein